MEQEREGRSDVKHKEKERPMERQREGRSELGKIKEGTTEEVIATIIV